MELHLPVRSGATPVKHEESNNSIKPTPGNGPAKATPHLLRLPASIRRRIYILAGVPQNHPLFLDKPKQLSNCCRLPDDANDVRSDKSYCIACTRSLLLTCRSLADEIAPLLYSGNDFITQDPKPLIALGSSLLGHLRSLRVVVHCAQGQKRIHSCMSHYPPRKVAPGPETEMGHALLAEWDDTARSIGPHISPGLLKLTLICEVAAAQKANVDVAGARIALSSLGHFPPLAACHIRLSLRRSKTLFEMARKAAEAATVVRREKPFRFADLPTEIRLRILEFTDLVTPSASLHWDSVRRYVMVYEGRAARKPPRQCDVSDVGCLCSRMHAVYSPDCRCWTDPTALFFVDRTTLILAREVFYRSHHFSIGYHMPRSPEKRDYPGFTYLSVIPSSAWRLLRSLKISSDEIPWEDPTAEACVQWLHMLRELRRDSSLALHYLRLNNYYPALPAYPDLMEMTTDGRLDLVRKIVHGAIWPLDAGDGACLPFATRHLELELRSKTQRLSYRLRVQGKALPVLAEAMDQAEANFFESRLLPGGRLQEVGKSEGTDVKAPGEEAVDWIEEIGIVRFYSLGVPM
jgi:hypothetical protein